MEFNEKEIRILKASLDLVILDLTKQLNAIQEQEQRDLVRKEIAEIITLNNKIND